VRRLGVSGERECPELIVEELRRATGDPESAHPECGVVLVIGVRKGQRLRWPRAETPTHYISMGLHDDLDEATRLATREMVEFLVAEKGLSRDDAYVLCSLAADLHVTQAVDQTKGVHATIAKSIFK
jgi:acetamidase/formamidase